MKFALVSPLLPPSPSGQAVAVYNLLKPFSPDEYCLISHENYTKGMPNASRHLPAPTYSIDIWGAFPKETRLTAAVRKVRPRRILNKLLRRDRRIVRSKDELENEINYRTKQIYSVIQREGCCIIIATTGDFYDFPAAFRASEKAHIPFVPYLFDGYASQWEFDPMLAAYAKDIELPCIVNACAVIVPNEFTAKEYKTRYAVDPVVLHNPVIINTVAGSKPLFDQDWFNIVFTGSIYYVNFDAFRNLIAAMSQIKDHDICLHIFTSQSTSDLENHNIIGPNVVIHSHVQNELVQQIQREADLLFLPLGFSDAVRNVVRTSAPGKMGEYLATGRPILVHAPEEAFVCWYFDHYECGTVVAENDPEALVTALLRIVEGQETETVEKAMARAMIDFDVEQVQPRFASLIRSMC